MNSKKNRVWVSGGAGYIGSILTGKLLEAGNAVVILDNFTYTDMGIRHYRSHPYLEVFEGDIRDEDVVRRSLEGVDKVVHLAAIANDPSGQLDPRLTQQVNYEVYPMLLGTARTCGVQKFINASTFGVYGIKDGIDITEEESLNPLKEYSVCKAKSEVLVRDANAPGFSTVSLRCSTVCGWSPRLRLDLIVNTLTAFALVDKKITVWGGEQKRPQIHIDDLTRYFIEILDMPGERFGGKIYNAGGQNTSILEIAETIAEVLEGQLEIEQAPARDDERTYHVSSKKIAEELGLLPKKTIKDAIKGLIQAYQRGLWKHPGDAIYHNVNRMKILGLDKK